MVFIRVFLEPLFSAGCNNSAWAGTHVFSIIWRILKILMKSISGLASRDRGIIVNKTVMTSVYHREWHSMICQEGGEGLIGLN